MQMNFPFVELARSAIVQKLHIETGKKTVFDGEFEILEDSFFEFRVSSY